MCADLFADNPALAGVQAAPLPIAFRFDSGSGRGSAGHHRQVQCPIRKDGAGVGNQSLGQQGHHVPHVQILRARRPLAHALLNAPLQVEFPVVDRHVAVVHQNLVYLAVLIKLGRSPDANRLVVPARDEKLPGGLGIKLFGIEDTGEFDPLRHKGKFPRTLPIARQVNACIQKGKTLEIDVAR